MKTPSILLFCLFCLVATFSHDIFAQWQPDIRLTNNTGVSYTSSFNNGSCIATSGKNLHVVWYDQRDGNLEIYYKRSTDEGKNWENDVRLTNDIGGSYNPSIAALGSYVHVVWYDNKIDNYEIYYKRSTDEGATWEADVRLTNSRGNSWYPSVSVFGTNIQVVWRDSRDGNYEIYHKSSTDYGTTWGSDNRLTNNIYHSWEPSISVTGSDIHIAWSDYRDGNWEIYYKNSSDGGNNWGPDIRLTNNSAISRNVSIKASDTYVHLVWQDKRDGINDEIYYKNSIDGGLTWGTDTRLSNNPAVSVYPSIYLLDDNVHVVWQDNRIGDDNIFYKNSSDRGINWGGEIKITEAFNYAQNPFICVSNSGLHLIWKDFRHYDWEIFYKQNQKGNSKEKSIGYFKQNQKGDTEIPDKYTLNQNYPNPFNPNTIINFSLPEFSHVQLIIYDALGNKISELIDQTFEAGSYEVSWSADELSSGVYFYKIIANKFSEVKKMVLVR